MNQKDMRSIRDIPAQERPYEKCLKHGAAALTDAELLAVVLRCGTRGCSSVELARQLLSLCPYEGGLTGILHLKPEQLKTLPGIGEVKAVQILCIGELSRRISGREAKKKLDFHNSRISGREAKKKLDFHNSKTIAEYYMEDMRHLEQEVVLCMMLDSRNQLLGEVEVSRGTVNCSLLSPREVFIAALEYHAVRIILVHNHPSGSAQPSREDIEVTRRIAAEGESLGITLLDHIVIGDREYVSILPEIAEGSCGTCSDR